jgi:hypothetical protein
MAMVDDGDPDGLKVYNLFRVKTMRIVAISVMITPVNYFIPASLPLCFVFFPGAKVRLEAVEMRGVRRSPHRLD